MQGHERAARADDDRLALAILDEVDYPMVLVTRELGVRLANRCARSLLRGPAPWSLQPGRLQIDDDSERHALSAAVADAIGNGLRRALTLRGTGTVAVVPVPGEHGAAAALLIFAKPSVCQTLSIDGFAREFALTPGETEVLHGLCAGDSPLHIARQRGVALSTVRTQIGSLRAKTDTKDIRTLLRQLAQLPPLVQRVGPTGPTTHGSRQ
jgi:DNA-binding CsgD family transcriptional regulator